MWLFRPRDEKDEGPKKLTYILSLDILVLSKGEANLIL